MQVPIIPLMDLLCQTAATIGYLFQSSRWVIGLNRGVLCQITHVMLPLYLVLHYFIIFQYFIKKGEA